MKKLSISFKVYILLILVLAVSNAVQAYMQVNSGTIPAAELPAPPIVLALANAGIVLVFYCGLGLIGYKLAGLAGFAQIWDDGVTNRQRFIIPAIVGGIGGVFLIVSDLIFSQFNGIGRFPHPSFPGSILASLSAGIGEELIFRLFFVPFFYCLISIVILRGRWRNQVFWVVSVASAVAFALGHLPSVMYLFGYASVGDIPLGLMVEIILLNGVIGMIAAIFLRKWGFLAAAGVHFWADIVWHVVWGVLGAML